LSPQDNGDYSRTSAKRASLAKPHLTKALALVAGPDQARILEKLTTIAAIEGDLATVERLLTERLAYEPTNQQNIEYLATIEGSLGKDKEAEQLYKKLWRLQDSENHQPYQPAMQHLATLYHKLTR